MTNFTKAIYDIIINNPWWITVVKFEDDSNSIVGTATVGKAIAS